MKLRVGTSGYSYKEWKGTFYPADLPAREMLRFYAERLPAVEINNTFYRLPKMSVLQSWAEQVPEGFRFALKASRRITHFKRLKDAGEETAYLLRSAAPLGGRLGVILFQLPPGFPKDFSRFEAFQRHLPDGTRAAFEFRHPSWLDDEIVDALRRRDFALCVADTDASETEPISTASWGYVRLRRSGYSEPDLAGWQETIRSKGWEEAFVFFKHEDAGVGPKLARRLLELAQP